MYRKKTHLSYKTNELIDVHQPLSSISKFNEGKVQIDIVATHLNVFMAGDLDYYAKNLAKAGSSSNWCHFCMKRKKNFGDCACTSSIEWTLQELRDAKKKVKGDKSYLGVIDDILVPDLPLMFYIVPLLHVQMGLVNKALDVLQDFVEKYVQASTEKEENVRDMWLKAEENVFSKNENLNYTLMSIVLTSKS